MDTTNTKLQSVIEKIRKLQALAGNNTSQHEIEAATAAAEKLIAEYRLSQAQIEAAGDKSVSEPVVSVKLTASAKRVQWKETLLGFLIEHYGCAYYISSFRQGPRGWGKDSTGSNGVCKYTVFGRRSDIEVIVYMFKWIAREIDFVAKIVSKGNGISYSNSWRVGCAMGIGAQFQKLKAEARQAQSNSAAMVLLSDRNKESQAALDNSGVKLGKSTSLSRVGNVSAYYAGRDHGSSMPLRQGLKQ